MAKAKRITSRGALVVADIALVDRLWSAVPSREAIAMVTKPPPAGPADAPGAREPFDATGLDVALSALTRKKTLDLPLAQALAAKRALGIPWRWLTAIPGAKEEARADERLLRWAEVTRLPDFGSSDVIVVASAVEGAMVGATEYHEACQRFGSQGYSSRPELRPGWMSQSAIDSRVPAEDCTTPSAPGARSRTFIFTDATSLFLSQVWFLSRMRRLNGAYYR